MLLRVSHLTRYDYSQAVSFSPHILYLRPRESPLHRLHRFRYDISPTARLVTTQDPQDNVLTLAHFPQHATALNIFSEFEIETLDTNPFNFLLKSSAIKFPVGYDKAERFALSPYLAPPFNETQTALRAWVVDHLPDVPHETTPFLAALTSTMQESITYVRRESGRSQPSARTLSLGSGSCRDFAVMLIETCRTFGFAARFVSGYLYDPPAPDAVDPAAAAMHAWVEVYLPGAGWKGLDPTRGIFCDDSFIPVAHAAQADVVTPVQGNYYAAVPVSAQLTTQVVVEKGPL